MIEKMKYIKDQFLNMMEKDVSQRGAESVNIKFHGEVADIIKDLSEAIYYCEVAKAMEDKDTESRGYGMGSRSGYGQDNRLGYGQGSSGVMGHSDPTSTIREMMMTADPETKMRIRNEINKM